jgi:hypothetical protein
MRPALATAGVDTDGQVRDQPDRHAGLLRRGLGGAEAAVGHELVEGVPGDLPRMILGELCHLGAGSVGQAARPVPPVPQTLRRQAGMQHLELGVGFERAPLGGAEAGELLPQRAAGFRLGEQGIQALEPVPRRGGPVHQRVGLQSGGIVPRQIDGGMQRVQQRPAGR